MRLVARRRRVTLTSVSHARTKKREYKSGSRWAFWRWSETDSGYLTRLHLIKTPWLAICLHWLSKPDPEPHLHDHPVSFLSIILRGWYQEVRHRARGRSGILRHRWFNFVRATPEDRHTIIDVAPRTVTLAIMGPKIRTWGFHRADGWISWQSYYAEQRAAKTAEQAKWRHG